MESIVYKAFCRWRNKMPANFYRHQYIVRTKLGPDQGKVSGEGMIYNGPPPRHADGGREREWMDYVCLRDMVDHNSGVNVKPALTKNQFDVISRRVLSDNVYRDSERFEETTMALN